MLDQDSTLQKKRDRGRILADLRFRIYGILGLLIAGSALMFLLVNIFSTGYNAFRQTVVTMEFHLDAETLGIVYATLDHLRSIPHGDALEWLWERWTRERRAS